MKNLVLSTVLILSSLAVPSAANASITKMAEKELLVLDDGCRMTVRGKTSDGHRFKVKGSCKEVLEILAEM